MKASGEKVFVVDDEPKVRDTIEEALTGEGFKVNCYETPLAALKALPKSNPDLVVTDLVMPGLDGLRFIGRLKSINPELNVVVITGHGSLDSAIGAIRAGASDYLLKPFKISELLESVQKALSQKRFPAAVVAKDQSFRERYELKNLIGTTPEMKEIFRLIEKVAASDSAVLIIGESGTGKEIVARTIHYRSKRKKGAFVSINCAALPENLLESELFGYEKGAFTSAVASKVGLLELAEGGTFLLDEVGNMPLHLQAKLLRVLQERTVKHLGGITDIPVDFRLIAATSKNLPEEIQKGSFREDLFYRLNVIPIVLPPLRERKEDIPLFVNYFIDFFSRQQDGKRNFKVSREAMRLFEDYAWPGNVRELEHAIERLTALAEKDEIDEELARKVWHDAISFSSRAPQPIMGTNDLRESLEVYERHLIEKAVQEAKGNKNQAARKLSLTRQALQYKIKKYGIEAKKP